MHRSLTALAAVAALTLPAAAASATHTEGHTTGTPQAAAASGTFTNMDNYAGDERYAAIYSQTIEWSNEACDGASIYPRPGRTYECATIKAPKNWHDPSMGTIDVGLGRVLEYGDWDADPSTRRLLLSNPGGPGGAGLNFGAVINQYIGAGESHNGIGIDPRGVGLSTNLQCQQPEPDIEGGISTDGDATDFTRDQVRKTNTQVRDFLATCAEKNAGWAEYVNSEQTARDFELVRHLMGYKTADIYGISYGTWLGSTIEKLFPNNYDRVVLDGNMPWGTGDEMTSAHLLQVQSLQAVADRMLLPFISRHNDLYGMGETTSDVDWKIQGFRRAIAKGELGDDVTANAFDDAQIGGARSPRGYHGYGMFLGMVEKALAGDEDAKAAVRERLVPTGGGTFSPSASMFKVIMCADTRVKRDEDAIYRDNEANARNLPLIGAFSVFDHCGGWPHKPAMNDEFMARPVSEALMLHNEADHATAWSGAIKTRHRAAGNVRMLAVDDLPGHGLPGLSNACTAQAINDYLVEGRFPTGDIHCQAGPLKSGPVTEDKVYEFERAASANQVLPRTGGYIMRNLSDPLVDEAASAATRDDVVVNDISRRADLDTTELFDAINGVTIER